MFHSSIRRGLPVVVGGALVGLALVVAPAAHADPAPVCAGTPSVCTVTFTATGGDQSFTVPAGVTQVTVTANGAQGSGPGGGLGGQSVSTLTVTPGQVLEVVVGTQNGFNGGVAGGASNQLGYGGASGESGGGASDVRSGSCAATLTCGLSDRAVVGGGGGGAGGAGDAGAPGGGTGGGTVGGTGNGVCQSEAGGSGGTQTLGGAPGFSSGSPGSQGSLGVGGVGGDGSGPGGGGGGGGYYGGGGGAGGQVTCSGGGGGGSSFGSTLTSGVQSGDGVVTISYNGIQAQTITFPQPTTPAAYGTSAALNATASSGLAVSYTVDGSSTPGACTISGSTVTYTGIGSCVIDANQAGNASFSAAPQVQWPVTVTQAATTTTLTVNPPSPALNQATTLTATVHQTGSGVAPTGTVSFYDGAILLGNATVQPDGTATLVTSFGGGTHSITAVYNGDSHYLRSTSSPAATFTVACTQTITGTHSSLTVTSGTTCLVNATITGGISVARGATLDIENSTVQGSISANHPAGLRICGSTTGAISVSGATGYVRIGDPASNCAPDTINGGLTAANNTGGGTISGNTITGTTAIANNGPTFTATGNHH